MIRPNDLVVNGHGTRFMGRHFPCAIGRGGITRDKREGDGATPAGAHRITGLLYRPERIARHHLPPCAQPIRAGDLWCDDPQSPRYNLLTSAPLAASHERMRRADPLYDIVLTTSWNWPHARPGLGSAIFIHIWRAPRFPTAGCVAFKRNDLLWIVNRLGAQSLLIVRP